MSRRDTYIKTTFSFILLYLVKTNGFLSPQRKCTVYVRGKLEVSKKQNASKTGTQQFSSKSSNFGPISFTNFQLPATALPDEESARSLLRGRPSTPGWKGDKLNRLTEWAIADEANRPIVREYDPDWLWLWTQFDGTVLSMTILPVFAAMAMSVGVDFIAHACSSQTWSLVEVPPADDPFIQLLQGVRSLWEYQVTLCTFILTFFTQEAYKHYRTVYLTTRAIQGRINDICLLITIGSLRGEPESLSNDNLVTGYSDEALAVVETCTRLIRLSHTFYWASVPTASNGIRDGGGKDKDNHDWLENAYNEEDAIGPLLLSPDGLETLVRAGELTKQEKESLMESGLPPSQYAYILLEWVGLYSMRGMKNGDIICDDGFEENLLRQICALRGEYFNIGDYTAGRMPLAYVQLVQVLVDSLVWLAPIALYAELGLISVPLTGLLTFFYKGLLRLSKSFLDPFGVEGSPSQNIRVDVLVSELNFGAGSRWVKAGEVLPDIDYATTYKNRNQTTI